MRLIGLAVVLAISLILAPLAAWAQQAGKVYHIGILSGGSPDKNSAHIDAFRRGLRDRGWLEGRDVVIEWRSSEGRTDLLTALSPDHPDRGYTARVAREILPALRSKLRG